MKLHSCYSIKYGILSPVELVAWAKKSGYSFAFLADINSTGAGLMFIREAYAAQIKPIVGAEIRNGMEIMGTIIAKNNRGYHELNQFITTYLRDNKAFPRRFPHFSNCYVSYPVASFEIQINKNEFFDIQLNDILHLNLKYNTVDRSKLLFLQPMSFKVKKDFNAHRLLRAIHHNLLLSKLPKEEEANSKEVLIEHNELVSKVIEIKDVYARTNALFDLCELNFDFGDNALPQNPSNYTGNTKADELLIRKLCNQGIEYRYTKITDTILSRIEKEISVIIEKQYLSYFLITWDFCSYARSQGYFYVGRGSGANSLVAYLLRITDVDPLELDLYFERFINLYRKNPPDFDIDFSWKDRDDVLRYIFEKYPNAAWLCTYNTFQYKATIRELGKVFGLPKNEIDLLVEGKRTNIKVDKLSSLVLQYGKYIEGLPSHLSVHSSGIVISEKPMTWYSALFRPPKGFPTTQFSMLEAEDVGLFKFDVLSQRGLGKIREALDIIAQNQPKAYLRDIHDVSFFKKDQKVNDLLLSTRTIGCFYIESPAMRMLISKLGVDNYIGLVAASSIIRPGVAQSGMMREYILRHHNEWQRKKANPILFNIMPDTYGVMVYQEDVIKVAHHFAGLSLAESDVLRRGMSGKFRSRSEFEQVKEAFYENCIQKGYASDLIDDVWRQIESFAGYAFSKGHSASYAVESYQSLYLKAYFPIEYMVSTINNFGGYYRTEIYVHEARRFGGIIEGPSIHCGNYETTLIGNRVVLGFNLLAGIESRVINEIVLERSRHGDFINFEDFMDRMSISLEQLSLIIRINGFRDFKETRKELLWKAHFYHSKKGNKTNPEALFPLGHKQFEIPRLVDEPHELAFEEMELLGFPLTNPFDLLKDPLPKHVLASELNLYKGRVVDMYGYLVSIKNSKTSNGTIMNFGTLIDLHGEVFDTVHFPLVVKEFPFRGKGIYYLKGKITEEFGYYSLEIIQMNKCLMKEDIRYAESISR